jgi:hypothetical protein
LHVRKRDAMCALLGKTKPEHFTPSTI